ncbi:hypothetical protein ACG74X_11745, partial [Marivita sp. S0852]|uniref:hypothetical protein n=1 Tax=Marivita sp. S0852 TaxID=3373893 RepID=UPI0039829072
GQDLSRTAANAQSLTRKALALCSAHHFLRSQTLVFPQNRREAAVCRGSEKSEEVQLFPTFEIEATALNTLSPLSQVLESLHDLFDGADSPFEVEAIAS